MRFLFARVSVFIDIKGRKESVILMIKRNLIANEALWYLLTSSFINYSFKSLEDCEDYVESNVSNKSIVQEIKKKMRI